MVEVGRWWQGTDEARFEEVELVWAGGVRCQLEPTKQPPPRACGLKTKYSMASRPDSSSCRASRGARKWTFISRCSANSPSIGMPNSRLVDWEGCI
jgi:hypothetical protein